MIKNLEDIKSEVHLMLQDLTHNELKDYFSNLIFSYNDLQQRIDKVKIEISALMSRYFYEEYFYIEDTDLDKLLQILDKGSDSNGQ